MSKNLSIQNQTKLHKQTDIFEYFNDQTSLKRYKRTEHGGLQTKNVRKNVKTLKLKLADSFGSKVSKSQRTIEFFEF